MTEIRTLRHDDPEAALPHQVELPEEWEIPRLHDPLAFVVDMPAWVPLDADSLVDLHWWACLVAHLNALMPMVQTERRIHYAIEKAHREAIQTVRAIYGNTVSAAIAVAGHNVSTPELSGTARDVAELSYWSMALQTAFGLLCVRAAAKGRQDERVQDIAKVREWVQTSFVDRVGDPHAALGMLQKFTGTEHLTVDEKLEQWRKALQTAAEGLPEGVDGVAEAIAPEAQP